MLYTFKPVQGELYSVHEWWLVNRSINHHNEGVYLPCTVRLQVQHLLVYLGRPPTREINYSINQ